MEYNATITRHSRGWDAQILNNVGGGTSTGGRTLNDALYQVLSGNIKPKTVKVNGTVYTLEQAKKLVTGWRAKYI